MEIKGRTTHEDSTKGWFYIVSSDGEYLHKDGIVRPFAVTNEKEPSGWYETREEAEKVLEEYQKKISGKLTTIFNVWMKLSNELIEDSLLSCAYIGSFSSRDKAEKFVDYQYSSAYEYFIVEEEID